MAKHRMTDTHIYWVWKNMRQRCSHPANAYIRDRYYAKGIRVCEEWNKDFIQFYNWAMANGYSDELLPNGRHKLTLDRINNYGNYEPSNCRWVDMKTQNENKQPYRKNINSKELISQKLHYKEIH